jgi:hypothetical protein
VHFALKTHTTVHNAVLGCHARSKHQQFAAAMSHQRDARDRDRLEAARRVAQRRVAYRNENGD